MATLAGGVQAMAALDACGGDFGPQEAERCAVLFTKVLGELPLESFSVFGASLHAQCAPLGEPGGGTTFFSAERRTEPSMRDGWARRL